MPQSIQLEKKAPRLAGIILAAGLSRRAAPYNKLLLPGRDGTPVVRCVAAAFAAAGLQEVIVVTGHQHDAVAEAVSGLSLHTVYAPSFASGMGNSLAAGVQAASQTCQGFLVCPGDLPDMSVAIVSQVALAFVEHGCAKNIIPVHHGLRGHPVALVADLRSKLEKLSGDTGAKILLSAPEEVARTLALSVESEAINADNDLG
ncbi:MAG: nucleotidyltransferase family protein [Nibricoccus sp.]